MLNNLLARLHYCAIKSGCLACSFLNRCKPFKRDPSQTRANTKHTHTGAGTLNLESTSYAPVRPRGPNVFAYHLRSGNLIHSPLSTPLNDARFPSDPALQSTRALMAHYGISGWGPTGQSEPLRAEVDTQRMESSFASSNPRVSGRCRHVHVHVYHMEGLWRGHCRRD